ncbi:MAG: aspartate carbamoyltransferase [Acidimicrobiales bacterium]|jgi:aspartate carbamoyltransferase catalytic subunit
MSAAESAESLSPLVERIGLRRCNLLSINDLSTGQILDLFDLGRRLEPWNRSAVQLLSGKVMAALFFQPSTRTRMSFETAMHRLGGAVLTETTPLISSSAAKEESLDDMLKVVSKYANLIVLRHFDDVEARRAVGASESPVINGGFGQWEHPTQALLDLYTLWRTYGHVDGLKVCIASTDLDHARTGHSMAYGLARLGAEVTLASPKSARTPQEVLAKLSALGASVTEEFDFEQDSFNELIFNMDLVYLPGCSAPKGPEADAFKTTMDKYLVRYETLERAEGEGHRIYVTHTLPRRAGEMDLRIDASQSELYFKAIAYSVSIRMALLLSIAGFEQEDPGITSAGHSSG